MKRSTNRFRFRFSIGLTLVLLAGCGSGSPTVDGNPSQDPFKEASIGEVGDLLRIRKTENLPPPSKVADLVKYRTGWPNGYKNVEEGTVIVVWGVPLQDGASDKIIAYEKEAPDSGGFVLMQDGMTIKKMTADEFKAAPKATKG